jgi:hypothetical protein
MLIDVMKKSPQAQTAFNKLSEFDVERINLIITQYIFGYLSDNCLFRSIYINCDGRDLLIIYNEFTIICYAWAGGDEPEIEFAYFHMERLAWDVVSNGGVLQ